MDNALPIAVKFIADREGFRAQPYQDVAGVWTVGYGFTATPDGGHVRADTPDITRETAEALLTEMVGRVLALVRGMVHVQITDHQAAALTSFAYNLGTNAVRNSTLMRLLNEGKPQEAAQQFGAWVYAGGKKCPGLINRRAAEAALFLTPDVVNA